jgi:hypothetical protein
MKTMGKLLTAVVIVGAALLLFLSDGSPASGSAQKKKKVKLDPEITAVQKSLANARARIKFAIENEVFGEKGKVEGAVIDQLKIALNHVNQAIKAARKAQQLDKGS